jgi:hypothetical protein
MAKFLLRSYLLIVIILMPSGGSLTLADVAARTETLAVACSRCDRAGRYRLDRLIERHGAAFPDERLGQRKRNV